MIALVHLPHDKERFVRLMDFFKEVLDICKDLNISPVLDGSLAVFAYTANQQMSVKDVDLTCSEIEFPRVMRVLDEKSIRHVSKEWHVLQIWQDDLKIELGSMEYWYRDVPNEYETLQIDEYQVRMLRLNDLREFYKQGMEDRAKKTGENERSKYEALKAKYEALKKVKR